ncbi:MAG: tRNA (adenosine(37)-N6)-dimethylallyltransferase MiaA [Bacteroidales bacterium]|nr:tRNA (adenosine(37)-N6)-dimethylallyltransferase MiaA [Bacteroidales bacterium]
MVALVGPTASGKTSVAVALARELNGEILSADSRQVYQGMNLGTGKDLQEYAHGGPPVPYHLIDIAPAGSRYNVFQYQHDFLSAYRAIEQRGARPILCGGSGLYVEAVLRGYRMMPVPENPELRQQLSTLSDDELHQRLAAYGPLHNTTDLDSRKRTIRAIEIADYHRSQPVSPKPFPVLQSTVFGIRYQRATEMARIRQRLQQRLDAGLIDEVRGLLSSGLAPADLIYYGLEYKHITEHLLGQTSGSEMFERLYIAIRQFAKRQMTWFRGMERRGMVIHWLEGELPLEQKLERILALL